jgi:hypothetical protein
MRNCQAVQSLAVRDDDMAASLHEPLSLELAQDERDRFALRRSSPAA